VGYATISDYQLGIVKAIPYKVPLALDAPAPSRWPPRRS
jgi:hypothetical protein